MNKDIRKLLSQKSVTGEQVGQALIRDMTNLYEQAYQNAGRHAVSMLTEEEKHRLVAMLTDPQDVRVYAQYRAVQSYLSNYQLVYSSMAERAESAFLRLYTTLYYATEAELISLSLRREGVAGDSPAMQRLLEQGYAKSVLRVREGLRRNAAQFFNSLRMCCAQERGLELVAQRIDVPEILVYQKLCGVKLHGSDSRLETMLRTRRKMADALRQCGWGEEDVRTLDEIVPAMAPGDLEPAQQKLENARALLQEDLSLLEDPLALMMLLGGNGRDRA